MRLRLTPLAQRAERNGARRSASSAPTPVRGGGRTAPSRPAGRGGRQRCVGSSVSSSVNPPPVSPSASTSGRRRRANGLPSGVAARRDSAVPAARPVAAAAECLIAFVATRDAPISRFIWLLGPEPRRCLRRRRLPYAGTDASPLPRGRDRRCGGRSEANVIVGDQQRQRKPGALQRARRHRARSGGGCGGVTCPSRRLLRLHLRSAWNGGGVCAWMGSLGPPTEDGRRHRRGDAMTQSNCRDRSHRLVGALSFRTSRLNRLRNELSPSKGRGRRCALPSPKPTEPATAPHAGRAEGSKSAAASLGLRHGSVINVWTLARRCFVRRQSASWWPWSEVNDLCRRSVSAPSGRPASRRCGSPLPVFSRPCSSSNSKTPHLTLIHGLTADAARTLLPIIGVKWNAVLCLVCVRCRQGRDELVRA